MFLIVAADQLRHRLRRSEQTLPKRASHAPSAVTPLPVKSEQSIPAGPRYQLLRALRAMARGQEMVVVHKIPRLPQFGENGKKEDEWLQSLHSAASWKNQNDIEPVLVPGTAYASVVGRILIRAGWCAPSEQPHWMPTMRFFFLTNEGRESLKKAQAWWAEQTPWERMRLMLTE